MWSTGVTYQHMENEVKKVRDNMRNSPFLAATDGDDDDQANVGATEYEQEIATVLAVNPILQDDSGSEDDSDDEAVCEEFFGERNMEHDNY
ncbi:hypothetical protein ACA910_009571 [Epithemia clementina (nom. ined.)]